MSTRAARVEALFHAALELEPARRAPFLATSCADDAELQREVAALLECDATDDARLTEPAPSLLALERDPTDALAGRRLGPYLLRRRIGSGGMGTVYEAEQDHPARAVAVKVLRSDSGVDIARRFRVESALLARLQHPAIAHVYDADVALVEGVQIPYIALELVEGARSITEFVRDEEPSAQARIELFATICDAVHHGHQRGVIHRDLKPANILIDRAGRPKLIDFGIARAIEPDRATALTQAGVFLGTVQYMSPEQCLDARELDVRSDVYSLGVVLYELLCGRLPYEFGAAPLPQAVRIVREQTPRRPSTVLRTLRGDLETILLHALEKDRARRYQSVAALADDLRRFLLREPIAARPPSWSYRLTLFAARHKVLAAALAVVVVVVLGATIVSARFAWREQRARLREEGSAYVANITAAELSLRAFDPAGARRRLAGAPERLRGWEWRYLAGQLDIELAVLRGPHARCESIDWRAGLVASAWHYPDGRALVVWNHQGEQVAQLTDLATTPTRIAVTARGDVLWGGTDGEVRLWEFGDAGSRTLVRHADTVTGVLELEDGRVASCSMDGTVRLASGEDSAVLLAGEAAVRDLARSADGALLVAGDEEGVVHLLPLDRSGDARLQVFPGAILAVALAFDGSVLAAGSSDGSVRVFDTRSRREVRRLIGHAGAIQDLAFLPSGELVSASADHTLRVWNLAAGVTRAVLYGHQGAAKCIALAPDGARVASGGYDHTARVWDPLAEHASLTPSPYGANVRDVEFSGDGALLATASRDGSARLFDTRDWREHALLAQHDERVQAIAFDPRGGVLATASVDGRVRLWSTADGSLLRTLTDHGDEVHALAYLPNGERLASGASDGRVLLHETTSYTVVGVLEHDGPLQSLACASNGAELASIAKDGLLTLWDIESGAERWRRRADCDLHDVAFSPDCRRLATASGGFDGTGTCVRLWDPVSGDEVGQLVGHRGVVLGVTFSPDGSRLASTATDGTVRLWEPASGEQLLTLAGHESWVWGAAFSPDGTALVSGSDDAEGGLRVWLAQ